MITLINDVKDKLAEIPGISYIDEDWGQLDEFSQNPPVRWPCTLVDIIDAEPSDAGNKVQLIDCTVLIRLADLRLNKTSQQAPANSRNNANNFFGLAQTIFRELHGWHKTNSHYNTLRRKGLKRVVRDDGIREYQIKFETMLTDVSAKPIITDHSNEVQDGIITPEVTVRFP